jgi:pimeloyl-ACP methyl ester carboxylesterase
VLLIPGLHFLGPFDPRLDRFARILANSGKLVLAPHLPNFEAMVVAPSLIEDSERALASLLERVPAGAKVGLMSISFGVLPASAVAAGSPRVSSLVTFGGYGSFEDTLRFCLLGGHGLPHDPLNRPALFLNLLDHLPAPRDRDRLSGAWLEYMRQTWGRPWMKERSRFEPVARSLQSSVHQADRRLYLQGCGVEADGEELGLAAIESASQSGAHHLRELTVELAVVHGRDDDVIPYTQAEILVRAAPRTRRLLTGMYSHTGSQGLAASLQQLPAAVGEGVEMLKILRVLGELGQR